MTRYSITYIHI